MHQSPLKQFAATRREKYADLDLGDAEADRRTYRGTQPKARKFLREEAPGREQRSSKQHPRG